MEHLAILAKKKRLLSKILSKEKTVESRWYKTKKAPFGTIHEGDLIYFKESGDPVLARAKAGKIIVFEDLSYEKIQKIVSKYKDKIAVSDSFADEVKDKRFCMLIELKDVRRVEPFHVDKSGFGMMCAWISIDRIAKIQKK